MLISFIYVHSGSASSTKIYISARSWRLQSSKFKFILRTGLSRFPELKAQNLSPFLYIVCAECTTELNKRPRGNIAHLNNNRHNSFEFNIMLSNTKYLDNLVGKIFLNETFKLLFKYSYVKCHAPFNVYVSVVHP